MNRLIAGRWWLGLLGLVWLGSVGQAQAWERPPMKVQTKFEFRVEVQMAPQINRPTAPWYAYFPADPRLMPSMQTTPYPPWPAQFPPQGPPSDFPNDAPKRTQGAPASSGPMLTQHWPSYQAYGTNLQPVGYVPAQAPSYWYQGR
jgi:hypothetical protein